MKTLKFQLRNLTKQEFKLLKDYCHLSNNLYNCGLYIVKQYFKETNKYIGMDQLEKELKSNPNYYLLPSQSSQQILRLIHKNYRSFFSLLKRKQKGQYNNKVKEPQYKKSGSMFNLIQTYQQSRIKNNKLMLGRSTKYEKEKNIKTTLNIPFNYNIDGKLKQVLIKPINNGQYFICYIQYEENKKEIDSLNSNNYLGMDLGINNLTTCVDTFGHSFIMNGKPLKSFNKYFNKLQSKFKSNLPNKRYWSKNLQRINQKRYWYVDNYMNQVISKIIKHCKEHDIGNIVVGYNKTWKQNMNLGKRNNQTFSNIPFWIFKMKLENKCEEFGIQYYLTEESYTSKCSSLDLESLEKHEKYLGKRIKRGLFKSQSSRLINADVNAAANILRKVIGDDFIQPIEGLMFNPVKCNI